MRLKTMAANAVSVPSCYSICLIPLPSMRPWDNCLPSKMIQFLSVDKAVETQQQLIQHFCGLPGLVEMATGRFCIPVKDCKHGLCRQLLPIP